MKLRLRGAKGILAGPRLTWDGCQEIEIDFAGKTGLIALSGENGAGKSSALECLSHYPQMVSRGGALYNHFMGRAAEKEFESEFMGNTYRSLVKMDCDQSKQEGYMWVNGKPMVNGKISAFSAFCNETFGSPYAYFRSQFSPQKSKATKEMQIENMDRGTFRELLREFLNLQKYAAWEETAKQAGNFFQGQVAGVLARASALEEQVGEKERHDLGYADAGCKIEMLQDDKTLLLHTLEEKRQAVDTLKATIHANTLALERREDLQRQIGRLEGELAKERHVAEGKISVLAKKYRALQQEIMSCDCTLQDRQKIEAAAVATRKLEESALELQGNIDQINTELPAHQQKVHDLEKEIEQRKNDVKYMMADTLLFETEKQRAKINEDIETRKRMFRDLDSDPETAKIKQEIRHLEASSKVADGIDADCQSTTCAAIAAINTAKKRLPEAHEELKILLQRNEETRKCITAAIDELAAELLGADVKLRERRDFLKQQTERINREISALILDLQNAKELISDINKLLSGYRQDLTVKRAEIVKQKALADRLPEIKIAETRKADLEKQLEEVTTAGTNEKNLWISWELSRQNTITGLKSHQAEIIIEDGAETKLQGILWDIKEIETVRIPAIEKEIQAARDRIATLRAELTRIEAAEKELAEVKNQRDLLTRNMTSWRYLQFATGKTGLQNLRIDGAAPRIVYNANRLLSQAYGALYSIRLETVNEAGKEDLQVKIIMENGQEVYLDDISGGQRCWVVQSLWLAMSLLNQEKSGKRFTYFCADENDGALDPDNAEKFTALYRPFMGLAELEQVIYISHKPSCRAMADHQLSFEHGKNPSWR